MSTTVSLGPATVSLGHDDPEADDADREKSVQVDNHEFGWDNEHPRRDVHVGEFRIEWRPVTNGEFYEFYIQDKSRIQMPSSWVEHEGEIQVRHFVNPSLKSVWLIPMILCSRFVRYTAQCP